MKQRVLFVFFIALQCLTSCKKEDKKLPSDVISNTTPVTGGVIGFVKLYEDVDKPMASFAGVTISILGANLTASSDVNGKFTIENIPQGTYKIKYEKQGFDYWMQQVYITGNGTVELAIRNLFKLPSLNEQVYTFTYDGYIVADSSYNFTATFNSSSFIITKTTLVTPFSTKVDVNITDPAKSIQYVDALRLNIDNTNIVNANQVKFKIGKNFLKQYSGHGIYMKAFTTRPNTVANIFDSQSGLYYYSNFTIPSKEVTFFVQ